VTQNQACLNLNLLDMIDNLQNVGYYLALISFVL